MADDRNSRISNNCAAVERQRLGMPVDEEDIDKGEVGECRAKEEDEEDGKEREDTSMEVKPNARLEEPCYPAPTDTPTTILERPLPTVRLVRRSSSTKWIPEPIPTLRINDILFIVSLLELANAVDVGANVFNKIPPSRPAIIVMAIGGTLALLILPLAVLDASRSLRNLKILSRERRALEPKISRRRTKTSVEEIAFSDLPTPDSNPIALRLTPLDQDRIRWKLNSLEVGLEAVDRLSMDTLMGIGALLVGVGTLLALGGGNRKIYLGSNLLTGYIGNVPPALSGLGNTAWSFYRWHSVDWPRNIHPGQWADIYPIFRAHQKSVRLLAMLNIGLGILGAAGSLMTASAYIHPVGVWGYVLLAPCILGQMVANRLIRNRVHYSRDTNEGGPQDLQVVLDNIRRSDARALVLRRLQKRYRRDKNAAAVAVDYLREIHSDTPRPAATPRTATPIEGTIVDTALQPEATLLGELLAAMEGRVLKQTVSNLSNGDTAQSRSQLVQVKSDSLSTSVDVSTIVRAAQKDSTAASDALRTATECLLDPGRIWEEEAVRRNLEIFLAACRLSSRSVQGKQEPKNH